MKKLMTMCCLMGLGVALAAEPQAQNVPDLMTTKAGQKVTTVEMWEKVRRPELMKTFLENEYGYRPVERPDSLTFETAEPDKVMMDGKALRKRIRARWTGPKGAHSFVFTAFIPMTGKTKPAPGFILICNRPPEPNIDPNRQFKSPFWPAEEIVARGYAALSFWNGDIAADNAKTGCQTGVFTCYGTERTPNSWGVLSAWAWGASRVLDWVETEPMFDAKHFGVVGHSRGGKTALVASVMDSRFAMACSNDSGCSGAKLNHITLPKSETIKIITRAFPHWFCVNYRQFAGKDQEIDFDQHMWMALIAPRAVAIASASEDHWAGQEGEYLTGKYASPAWELYGKKGLVSSDYTKPGEARQEGTISYHLRPGGHNLLLHDWNRYMDFADRLGWRK